MLDHVEEDTENQLPAPAEAFYLALAQETGGPVLDLACGTGSLTIPLAMQNLVVTGVDISARMIEHARRKAEGLDIEWKVADCRALHLEQNFQLAVMSGSRFQGFLTRADQEALLQRVRAHLRPGGLFAFETRNPLATDLLQQAATEQHWHRYIAPDGEEIQVSSTQHYDPVLQIAHYVNYRRTRSETHTSRVSLRYIFPQEMEALLHYNGFNIFRRFGDWDFRPLSADSPLMIYICQPSP